MIKNRQGDNMKDKVKLYLDDKERISIVNSLTHLKESLVNQNISTDSVEEIISRISDKPKLELDVLDSKIVIKALYEMRMDLKEQEKPYDDISNILLKMIDETDKKKSNLKEDISR